jgi:hypothetical protein
MRFRKRALFVAVGLLAAATIMSARRGGPAYFYKCSVEGYAIGIDVLLYTLTH